MLTPQYFDDIEFNKVVEIYNKLNIDITGNIIKRIENMGDISSTSKKQIQILAKLNGEKIFKETLQQTNALNAQTKKELIKLFDDMSKADLEGYEELYNYRNIDFKLSASQYQILNQGMIDTNKTLKNLTKSIAFSSQTTYINAVDEAYFKVATGGIDYNTVMQNTTKKLAEQGITLKDSAGRNTQLDVAVRRNILNGVQQTANNMNKDIEKNLGCDGYEVTAHMGARETHAEAQGKQYAIDKETAQKYNVGLWKDVEDLWKEPNCRHTYFGIIFGVSESQYTNKELNNMKNKKVTLNGEKIDYYQATQKQRQIERNIRNTKRTIANLENKEDISIANTKLKKYYKEYSNFSKETGIDKQSERIKVI